MSKTTRGIWFGAAGLVAVALISAGCGTMSGRRIAACRDSNIGYWMSAAAGNVKLKAVHATRLASMEFALRKRIALPSTLNEMRSYRDSLLAPVEVNALLPEDSPDLRGMSAADVAAVKAYAAAHRDAGLLAGAKYSVEWAEEIARISPKMAALEDKVGNLVRAAAAKLEQGDLAGAEAGWREASGLDSEGKDVLRLEKQLLEAKGFAAVGELAAELGRTALKKATGSQKIFGTPGSSEAAVRECLGALAAADKAVAEFRDGLKTARGERVSSGAIDKALLEMERETAGLRSACWAEQVRLLGEAGRFWDAYQYMDERMKEAAGLPEHRGAVLKSRLAEACGRVLQPAVSELVTRANRHAGRDAHGTALTLCRMAEEMLHFAREHEVPIPAETLTWEKRCNESRSDAQKMISGAVQRRVLMAEFTPQVRENQRLFARVLERCSAAASDPPAGAGRAAWGVTVEKLAEKAKPSDYVIDCNVADLYIVGQAPVEMERSILKIARDVREIPNPDYNPAVNKSVPKTVFSQEVYLYQKTRTRHSRKARLQVGLWCTHENRRKNILSLDTEFSDSGTKLEGVRMSSTEEQLDVPFAGPPRISAVRSELVPDPWPRGVPPALSSEAEIAEAVQRFAIDRIADTVTAVASAYPVDVLAAGACRQGKLGNKNDSANGWGHCLEYCSQLVPAGGEADDPWPARKQKMLARIQELCGTYWKDCDAEALRKMPDLWSEAVRSALATE